MSPLHRTPATSLGDFQPHASMAAAVSTTRGRAVAGHTSSHPDHRPTGPTLHRNVSGVRKAFSNYFTSGHRVVGPESRWTEIEFGTIQGKSRDLKCSLYCFEEQQQKDEFNSVVSCLVASDCNPIDCISLGSSVPGILQARILQWVAMPSSRGSSRSRDRTHLYPLNHQGSPY